MKTDSGKSTSVWMATAEIATLPSLTGDVDADVCIVGAGIAGMTTAYMLAGAGKSVIVVDDGAIGGGETCRTTAHLSTALDLRYHEIERLHGTRGARLVAESHARAIDMIAQIVRDEKIDCDFLRVDGYLFVPPGEERDSLYDELQAAHRAGLEDVEIAERLPYAPYDFGPALRFPNQGQFHVLKYMTGLAAAAKRRGVMIYGGTHVAKVEGGSRARVDTTDGWSVAAETVIVATNTPVNDRVVIHTKQSAYRSYVIGLRLPLGTVPKMLLWDTANPYHYVRLQTLRGQKGDVDRDLLLVGGEDHKAGQSDDSTARHDRLEEWARERFPMAGPVEYRWSGQVIETVDGLAFIGRNPFDEDNVLVATGDCGSGMTYGTIAGILLTDLVERRNNEWAALYDPSRVTLCAAGRYLLENLNVGAQFADLVTGGDVATTDEIGRGEGAIVGRGLAKIAAYRDASGSLHEHSAVCPHLGGIVAWNSLEKTWDCPCHGSRFDKTDGHPLNGPAIEGLPLA